MFYSMQLRQNIFMKIDIINTMKIMEYYRKL